MGLFDVEFRAVVEISDIFCKEFDDAQLDWQVRNLNPIERAESRAGLWSQMQLKASTQIAMFLLHAVGLISVEPIVPRHSPSGPICR